jgi:hypothetical protein
LSRTNDGLDVMKLKICPDVSHTHYQTVQQLGMWMRRSARTSYIHAPTLWYLTDEATHAAVSLVE